MQYKQNDITNKKTGKPIKIKKEQLSYAAEQALLEAGKWIDAIRLLEKSNQKFDIQICILALLSIELYLKAILMKKGIQKVEHNIYELYKLLNELEKERLKEGITPDGRVPSVLLEDYIQLDSFEQELEFISNDFVYLRYEYEKYSIGCPIFILNTFILGLLNNAKELANSIVYDKNAPTK